MLRIQNSIFLGGFCRSDPASAAEPDQRADPREAEGFERLGLAEDASPQRETLSAMRLQRAETAPSDFAQLSTQPWKRVFAEGMLLCQTRRFCTNFKLVSSAVHDCPLFFGVGGRWVGGRRNETVLRRFSLHFVSLGQLTLKIFIL